MLPYKPPPSLNPAHPMHNYQAPQSDHHYFNQQGADNGYQSYQPIYHHNNGFHPLNQTVAHSIDQMRFQQAWNDQQYGNQPAFHQGPSGPSQPTQQMGYLGRHPSWNQHGHHHYFGTVQPTEQMNDQQLLDVNQYGHLLFHQLQSSSGTSAHFPSHSTPNVQLLTDYNFAPIVQPDDLLRAPSTIASGTDPTPSRARRQQCLSTETEAILRRHFEKTRSLKGKELKMVAEETGLTKIKVYNWFYNRGRGKDAKAAVAQSKPKKPTKWHQRQFSDEVLAILGKFFKKERFLNAGTLAAICEQTKLTKTQVQNWYANRRAKGM